MTIVGIGLIFIWLLFLVVLIDKNDNWSNKGNSNLEIVYDFKISRNESDEYGYNRFHSRKPHIIDYSEGLVNFKE